jgi:hypothetical protein
MAGERYKILRSDSDTDLYLLCPDGKFEQLPDAVRRQGPWQALRQGDVTDLKETYRVRLGRYGFVLEHTKLAVFSLEN